MEKKFNCHLEFCEKQLEKLKRKIEASEIIQSRSDFCIYTTGSYARQEAGENSDLDLFFIYENSEDKFPKIIKTLIDSELIKICNDMRLPEFSGDGEYLEIHNIKEIYKELGSRNDDYTNFFTARMLLLLESKSIHNKDLYDKIIKNTVQRYYVDFATHKHDFLPVFLVNDIIRFWRTMCLNYEHNRSSKINPSDTKEIKELKKNKAHVKNLKLKFSRKLMCFSFLLSILYEEGVLNKNKIIDIVNRSPLERLKYLSQTHPNLNDNITKIYDLYSWFLEITHKDETDLMNWINDETNRDFAFGQAAKFAKLIFELMIKSENKDKLLYFVI